MSKSSKKRALEPALTLYHTTIPPFIRALTLLSNILKLAEKDAKAVKIDQSILVQGRLFRDMDPFVQHVQRVTDIAKFTPVRIGHTQNAPRMEDNETTFKELIERIKKTIEFLKTVDPASMATPGIEEEKFSVKRPLSNHEFTGLSYVTTFVLPNFYFHMSVAYCILRMQGVPVGKADYLGHDVYP